MLSLIVHARWVMSPQGRELQILDSIRDIRRDLGSEDIAISVDDAFRCTQALVRGHGCATVWCHGCVFALKRVLSLQPTQQSQRVSAEKSMAAVKSIMIGKV
jgi:hypothetical protein